jgi:hypothetical protein
MRRISSIIYINYNRGSLSKGERVSDNKKKSLTLEHFESATLLAHYIPHLQISKKSKRIVAATKDKFFVIT